MNTLRYIKELIRNNKFRVTRHDDGNLLSLNKNNEATIMNFIVFSINCSINRPIDIIVIYSNIQRNNLNEAFYDILE